MAYPQDPLKEISHYLIDKAYDVLRMFSLSDVPEKSFSAPNINLEKLRESSALSTLARATIGYEIKEAEEIKPREGTERVIVKYFDYENGKNRPVGYLRVGKKPWERAHRVYNFLEGVSGSPRVYGYDAKARMLFIQDVGEMSLEEKLEDWCETPEDRVKIMRAVLDKVVKFQMDASSKLSRSLLSGGNGRLSIDPKVVDLFSERGMKERALDYLRAVMKEDDTEKLPRELKEAMIEAYKPISEAYEARLIVCHGDLNLTNVVIDDKGNVYLIDSKPRLREPFMTDLANLLSCGGVNLMPDDWKFLAEYFGEAQLKELGARPETEIFNLKTRFKIIDLQDEVRRRVFGSTFKGIIHHSFRILAKNRDAERFLPIKYARWIIERPSFMGSEKELKANIKHALDALIEKPEDFDVREEDASRLVRLRDIFKEQRIYDDFSNNTQPQNSNPEKQEVTV